MLFYFLPYCSVSAKLCYVTKTLSTQCPNGSVKVENVEEFYEKKDDDWTILYVYNNFDDHFTLNMSKIVKTNLTIIGTRNYIDLFDFPKLKEGKNAFYNSSITIKLNKDQNELNFSSLILSNSTFINVENVSLNVSEQFQTSLGSIANFNSITGSCVHFDARSTDIPKNFSKTINIYQETPFNLYQTINGFDQNVDLICSNACLAIFWPLLNTTVTFIFKKKGMIKINTNNQHIFINLHIRVLSEPYISIELNIFTNSTLNIVEFKPEILKINVIVINTWSSTINIYKSLKFIPVKVMVMDSRSVICAQSDLELNTILVKGNKLMFNVTKGKVKVDRLIIRNNGSLTSVKPLNIHTDTFSVCDVQNQVNPNVTIVVDEVMEYEGNNYYEKGIHLEEYTNLSHFVNFHQNNTLFIKDVNKTNWPFVAYFYAPAPSDEEIEKYRGYKFYSFCSNTLDCSNFTTSVTSFPSNFLYYTPSCIPREKDSCIALHYDHLPWVYNLKVYYKGKDAKEFVPEKNTFLFTEENISTWQSIVVDITESVTFTIVGNPKVPISFDDLDHRINVTVTSYDKVSVPLLMSSKSASHILLLNIINCTTVFKKKDTNTIELENINIFNDAMIDKSVYKDFNCKDTVVYCDLSTINNISPLSWKKVHLNIYDESLFINVHQEYTFFNNKAIINANLHGILIELLICRLISFNASYEYTSPYPIHIYNKNMYKMTVQIEKGFDRYKLNKLFHLHDCNHPIIVNSEASYFPISIHSTSIIHFIETPPNLHICEQETMPEDGIVFVYPSPKSGTIIFDTLIIHKNSGIVNNQLSTANKVKILSLFIDDYVTIRLSNVELQGFFQIPAHSRVFSCDVMFKSVIRIALEYPVSSGMLQQSTKYYKATFPEAVTLSLTSGEPTKNSTMGATIRAETANDVEKWMDALRVGTDVVNYNGKTLVPRPVLNGTKIFIEFDTVEGENLESNVIILATACTATLLSVLIFLLCIFLRKPKDVDKSNSLISSETLISIT